MTHTLQDIAKGCWNGACYPTGLLHSLGDAMKDRKSGYLLDEEKADLRIILDHVSSLLPGVEDCRTMLRERGSSFTDRYA